MCSTKRVQLAVVFLIVAALVAGTPARAGKFGSWQSDRRPGGDTCKLTPTGDEPGASGQAKLSNVVGWRPSMWDPFQYWGDVSVTCSGLTPGEKYWIGWWAAGFTASAKGTGSAKCQIPTFPGESIPVVVSREDMVEGMPTLVPVLEATLVCP